MLVCIYRPSTRRVARSMFMLYACIFKSTSLSVKQNTHTHTRHPLHSENFVHSCSTVEYYILGENMNFITKHTPIRGGMDTKRVHILKRCSRLMDLHLLWHGRTGCAHPHFLEKNMHMHIPYHSTCLSLYSLLDSSQISVY